MGEVKDPGWNGLPGAPMEPPPDDVLTGEDGEPLWTDGDDGPEWLTAD